MTKILSIVAFVTLFFFMMLSFQSCGPCDRIPPLAEKVDGQPFTYRIIGADGCPSLRPHLLRAWAFDFVPDPNVPPYIMVHQWHQHNINVHWEIIAREPISADGFELTIGQVPEGFEQVVPPLGQSFIPVIGKDYYFNVETDWPCYQTYGTLDW